VKESEYPDKVAMHKPMKFAVKINSKIEESQDNADRISNFKQNRSPYSVGPPQAD